MRQLNPVAEHACCQLQLDGMVLQGSDGSALRVPMFIIADCHVGHSDVGGFQDARVKVSLFRSLVAQCRVAERVGQAETPSARDRDRGNSQARASGSPTVFVKIIAGKNLISELSKRAK